MVHFTTALGLFLSAGAALVSAAPAAPEPTAAPDLAMSGYLHIHQRGISK